MVPLWNALFVLARAPILALVAAEAIRLYLGRSLIGFGFVVDCLVASTLLLPIVLLDACILYPRYRSPLRHLPVVPGGYSGRLIVEKPRGKTPLSWATQYPDEDLLLSRGKFGESLLFPFGPTALKDVFTTNRADFVKPEGLRFYLAHLGGRGLIWSESVAHKTQRRPLQAPFTMRHIRSFYPTMWQKSCLLAERLEAMSKEAATKGKANGLFDIAPWISRSALDILGTTTLSHEFGALDMKDYHPVAKSLATLFVPDRALMSYMMHCLFFPMRLVDKFSPRAAKWIRRERENLEDVARSLYQTEKEKPSDEEPSTILGNIVHDAPLAEADVIENIRTFLGAGHETSVASAVWACYLLGLPENKRYQDFLREEVREKFPAVTIGESVDPAALQDAIETSPWLHAIVQEVFRLYPAIPTTLRDSIRQTSIAGTVIPPNTRVSISIYAINRNPRYWGEEASLFRPERWLDSVDGTHRPNNHGGADSNYCFMSFSQGPRTCIGREYATAEIKCKLATIFRSFELEGNGPTTEDLRPSGQITMKLEDGLPVRLTPVV